MKLDSCGCCQGVKPITPESTANRPGLEALDYRVGTHGTFLETMKARLSSKLALQALTTRESKDFALAILDAWATIADVLSFYQERIANEGYLLTAAERHSILELGRLVGYTLKPGVAASTYLAFTLEDEFGETEIPAGARVQSTPEPGEAAQTFETTETIKAHSQWNVLKPRKTRPQVLRPYPKVQNTSVRFSLKHNVIYLKGKNNKLKPYDLLLLEFPANVAPTPLLYYVQTIEPRPADNITVVTLRDIFSQPKEQAEPSHPVLSPSLFANTAINPIATAVSSNSKTWVGLTQRRRRVNRHPEGNVIDDLTKKPQRPRISQAPEKQVFHKQSEVFYNLMPITDRTLERETLYSASQSLSVPVTSPETEPAKVHVFRKQARPFGYNAQPRPVYYTNAASRKRELVDFGEWSIDNPLNQATPDSAVKKHRPNVIYLDKEYDIFPDSWAVIFPPDNLPVILNIKEPEVPDNPSMTYAHNQSLMAYGLTGPTTKINLGNGKIWLPEINREAQSETNTESDPAVDFNVVRETLVFVESEQLELAEKTIEDMIGIPTSWDEITQISDIQDMEKSLRYGLDLIAEYLANTADLNIREINVTKSSDDYNNSENSDDYLILEPLQALVEGATNTIDNWKKGEHDLEFSLGISLTFPQTICTIFNQIKVAVSTNNADELQKLKVAISEIPADHTETCPLEKEKVGRLIKAFSYLNGFWDQLSDYDINLDEGLAAREGLVENYHRILTIIGGLIDIRDLITVMKEVDFKSPQSLKKVLKNDDNFKPSKVAEVLREVGSEDFLDLPLLESCVLEENKMCPYLVWHLRELVRSAVEIADQLAPSEMTIKLDSDVHGLVSQQTIIISGERLDIPGVMAAEPAIIAGIKHEIDWNLPGDKHHTVLVLSNRLTYAYKRDTVKIYANVARATQGETHTEILGSGNNSKAFQTFSLSHLPLTYLAAPNVSGVESTLAVRVNDLLWHGVNNLANTAPTDHSYLTRIDHEGKTTLMFGDGKNGARLHSGFENVEATYRSGIGKAGNVKAQQIDQLSTRPDGVKGVINPIRATGGADPESRDQARRNVPLALMALDRLVSAEDYAYFARTFAGIAKASVMPCSGRGASCIQLTIAGLNDIPIEETSLLYENLLRALHKLGDPRQQIQIKSRELLVLVIIANVQLLPDYRWISVEPKIRAALLKTFGFENRDLGQDIYLSEVLATIQTVPGVAYVDLDYLNTLSEDDIKTVFSKAFKEAATANNGSGNADPLKDLIGDAYRETAPKAFIPVAPQQLAILTPEVADTLILKEVSS